MIRIIFLLVLGVSLLACSEDKTQKKSNIATATVNLNACQIENNSEFKLSSLISQKTYDVESILMKNYKKKKSLGRNLNNDEYELHSSLNSDIVKVESILSQLYNMKPENKDYNRRGYISSSWENGMSLYATGYSEKMEVHIGFDPSKTKFIPDITNENTIDYIEALFKNRIISKNDSTNGGSIVYLDVECDGVILQLELKDKNAEIGSSGWEFERSSQKLTSIAVNLSKRSNKNRSSSLKDNNTYMKGQRVNVLYKNGIKCEAVVIIPGSHTSKIEFTDFCDINFASNFSEGDQKWASNTALLK